MIDISETWKKTHTELLCSNYSRCFGSSLISSLNTSFNDLFNAPFVLLSHGCEDDPILSFGNQLALSLWEMNWNELTQTPSRLTAEPMEREARSQFLQEVQTKGFVSNYEGIRISKTGKRFWIKNVKVWNLLDNNNCPRGQAACFDQWTFL